MHTAAVHMHAGTGVQPHPLYSVTGAVLGTALVCAGLLWAFTHSLPNIPAQLMQLSLVAVPLPTPKRVPPSLSRTPTPKTVTQPVTAKPVVIPVTHALQPPTPSTTLNPELPGLTFAPPAASAFQPQVFNRYSDLYKELTAPRLPSEMQNGDAYHSEYGFGVVKANGRCGELKTIQIGPSPSVKAVVGFLIPCPGEYQPSMSDELKAWADKQAAKNPGGS